MSNKNELLQKLDEKYKKFSKIYPTVKNLFKEMNFNVLENWVLFWVRLYFIFDYIIASKKYTVKVILSLKFRIKNKSFLISLILKYNLEPTCVYSCKGVYSKKLNAVIANLDESNLDLYNIIEPQG